MGFFYPKRKQFNVMKKISLTFILALGVLTIMAQNESDALRFSQQFYQGTARSMGMGGAFGALGADFSSLSTNPAGLGLYRSSEYTISPDFMRSKTESTYNGMFGEDMRGGLSLSNFGMVFTYPAKQGASTSPWRFYQFAFGMNKTNNFNNRYLVRGDNQDHSKIDVYLDRVWDLNPSDIETAAPFDLYPAWYVYLLDTITIDGFLYYDSPVPMGGIRQQESMSSWGSTNEWLFAGGANLNDLVFIGATLGLPYTRYFRESTYGERDIADTIPGFNYWNFTERVETRGWGINLKLGVIAWPVDWLRVGAALHTPTHFYGLRDIWYTSTEAQLGPDFNRKSSPTGEYNYTVTTPLKAIGSAAFIIGTQGSVSIDYEYVDYTSMRLRSSDYNFDDENDAIRNSFSTTSNIRLGGEWRMGNFNLRGGYAIYGSPYANNLNDGARTNYALGIGYAERSFGIDLAWVRGVMNQDYYLYSYENPQYNVFLQTNAAKQTITSDNFVLTLRMRF